MFMPSKIKKNFDFKVNQHFLKKQLPTMDLPSSDNLQSFLQKIIPASVKNMLPPLLGNVSATNENKTMGSVSKETPKVT